MKNIFKKIWKVAVFAIFNWAYKRVYNFIDEDNDSYISEEELKTFPKRLKELIDKFKNY